MSTKHIQKFKGIKIEGHPYRCILVDMKGNWFGIPISQAQLFVKRLKRLKCHAKTNIGASQINF